MPRDQNDPKGPQSARDRSLDAGGPSFYPSPGAIKPRVLIRAPSRSVARGRALRARLGGWPKARAPVLSPLESSRTAQPGLAAPRAQSRKRRIESRYGRHGAPSPKPNQSDVQDFGRCDKRFARKRKLGPRSWRRSDRGRSTARRRRTPIDIANANTGHPKAADAFWRYKEAFERL